MDATFRSNEINIGFHPDGYRIDKTALPMNRYTKWQIISGKRWVSPQPVCFDSLPQDGWVKVDKFDWNRLNVNQELF
jgi:hypothetical protein